MDRANIVSTYRSLVVKLLAALGALQVSMNWLAILESGMVGGGEYACGERLDDRCD